MPSQFVMLQSVPLKSLPNGSERLIQDLIAADPSILGLGHLELQARERVQTAGGRIDLVLRNESGDTWYEVEIQLRGTDPSHIVRTIEYWVGENRRHPEKDHIAVIVAEEITGRFFNVISLLNQNIPIIAIMVTATKVGDNYGLLFTKVLRPEPRDAEDEAEPEVPEADWNERAAPFALKIVREVADYAKANLNRTIELKFNTTRIGTLLDGRVSNFVTFRPGKRRLHISFHCARTNDFDRRLEEWGVEWEYKDGRYQGYRLNLLESDAGGNDDLIKGLTRQSYEDCEGEDAESGEIARN